MMRPSLTGDARVSRREPVRRRAGRRWPALVGYAGLSLVGVAVALCIAAVAVLLLAPPLDAVRDRLIRQVQERTGRTLTVAGPISVALLPRPVVTVEGVALLPPAGMAAGPTVSVPSLQAEVSLWSLLSRRPKLAQVTLNRPSIDLVVDAQGRRSWDAEPRPKAPATPASPAVKAGDAKAPGSAAQPAARLRRPRPFPVRIDGGTVRYRDERSGVAYEVSALELELTTDAADAALTAVGAFSWEGVPFRLSVVVAEGRDAAVAIKLAGAPLELGYEGRLAIEGGVAAEGTLSLAHLAYKDVKLGPARLPVSIAGGIAKLTLAELALYGGRGEGSLTVDTTGGTPAVSASLKLADVSLQPLLKDAAGAKWLDGRGAVTLALSGQGASERQLLETLQGQVQLAVADGAVSGFDVERMLSGLQRGRLDRLAPRAKDRTTFSTLTGSFDVAAGVARTSDLKLASKQVELKGEGQIELAARRIDVTLETKIEGGAPAEGAVVNLGTVQIPIAIKGPLDRPELSIKGQEALSATIGALAKGFKSREVQDAIQGLLGGGRGKRAKAGDEPDAALKKD